MKMEVRDLATPLLKRIAAQVQRPRALMQVCGMRVAKDLQRYFEARNSEPNQKGWFKSGWWLNEVARNTAFQRADDTEAVVSIASRQFAHRMLGGQIQGHPFLAIPLTEEAKRKGSPGAWTNKGDGKLVFIRSKLGACYLFPGKGQSHDASYLLVRSDNQKADPRALPPASELEAGVEDEANMFLKKALAA